MRLYRQNLIMKIHTLNLSSFPYNAWLVRLLFIALLVLLVSCKEEHKANGLPTSDLEIRAAIVIDGDLNAPVLESEATYINVIIYRKGGSNGVKLESGGNVTAHVNGDTYVLERIEFQPNAPYNYDKHYYYELRIPYLVAQTEIRISINRPSEDDAPSSLVRVPEQPVITSPTEGEVLYRSNNIYVSWVPDINSDSIALSTSACNPEYLSFATTDIGSFTILSDNFGPYASPCDTGISMTRIRAGTIDSALNQGTIVVRRYGHVGFSILP